MLLTLRALNGSKWCNAINKFLHSPYYIALVSALAVVANLFGGELPVWYIFAALGIVIVLFAEDTLPVVPMIGCGYISVSAANNPAGHYGTSLFQDKSALIQLAVIAALIVASLGTRFVFDLACPKRVERVRRMPRLTSGFALLAVAYILAGVTLANDYGKSVLFGLVQIVCLVIPYLYFYYTVNWGKVSRTYLAQSFLALGLAITVEVIGMYVMAFLSLSNGGGFSRGQLVTGWGVYNNVGFLLAFCIPFAFNLALRCRHRYIYFILAHVMELALVFTQSRGSILFGTIIYAGCFIYAALYLNSKQRWIDLGILVGFVTIIGVAWAIFPKQFSEIFATMKHAGWDDSGRFELYKDGLKQFAQSAQSVFLGNGFYAGGHRYGNLPADAFLPPRYHNTVIQLLASGGLIAFTVIKRSSCVSHIELTKKCLCWLR